LIDISVKFDSSKLPASLNKLAGNFFDEIIEEAVHPYIDYVQDEAQRSHRFRSKSGKLERSVRTKKTDKGGSVYLDESIAPYAEHVHDGHGSWQADRFLLDAEDDRYLDKLIDKAIDDILKREDLI
jgi:hypothetical protein